MRSSSRKRTRTASAPVGTSDHRLIIGSSREMPELADASVHLVVTSPPYPMIELWDDVFRSQGAGEYDAMHRLLTASWAECRRVLVEGGILVINIGDATRTRDGRFQVYPNHARTIEECQRLGFVTLPYILWKKPTNRPNAFLGSGFLPPNAYVTLDCEYILVFRKGGLRKFVPHDAARERSKFSKPERDVWFSQVWEVRGVRQDRTGVTRRTAAFPPEIPSRLIRMFSVEGDTVLDPFAGTGTTMVEAGRLGRNSIGFELDPVWEGAVRDALGAGQARLGPAPRFRVERRPPTA